MGSRFRPNTRVGREPPMQAIVNGDTDATKRTQDDPAAFAAIYDRYVERIHRFIYSRVHDRTLAEEITEDVFFKALEHMSTYRERGCGVGPWLYRIAENAIADHYRRRARVVTLEARLADQPSADDVQRSEEHTSELQSRSDLVCRLLLEKKKKKSRTDMRSKRKEMIS